MDIISSLLAILRVSDRVVAVVSDVETSDAVWTSVAVEPALLGMFVRLGVVLIAAAVVVTISRVSGADFVVAGSVVAFGDTVVEVSASLVVVES